MTTAIEDLSAWVDFAHAPHRCGGAPHCLVCVANARSAHVSRGRWEYVGWLVIANGREETCDVDSLPVWACKRANCYALIAGTPEHIAAHDALHRRSPNTQEVSS